MLITSQFSRNPAPLGSHAPSWPAQPEAGANQAIAQWGLLQKGWMGFDQIPWVAELRKDYPEAISLAQTCSITRPEFREQVTELFQQAPAEDRPRLRDYFAGKLGLEELSCRRNGAGAGMCDKRSAFQEIYQIANQAVQDSSVSGPDQILHPAAEGSVLPAGGILV